MKLGNDFISSDIIFKVLALFLPSLAYLDTMLFPKLLLPKLLVLLL
jgi:hypothetical protein